MSIDLAAVHLAKGAHRDPAQGACLLEEYGPKIAVRLVGDGDCLVYTGHRDENGYGRMYFKGQNRRLVHRVVWELINGPIPDGMAICHRCDNPPCCYVDHLFLGTLADNNRDREAKGRSAPNLALGRAALKAKAEAVTHCPQGHPYSGDNVRYRPSGARRCAQCYRDRGRANRDQINARRRALRAERSA